MQKSDSIDLKTELMAGYIKKLENLFPTLEELSDTAASVRLHVMKEIMKFSLSIRTSDLDKDELNNFFDYQSSKNFISGLRFSRSSRYALTQRLFNYLVLPLKNFI